MRSPAPADQGFAHVPVRPSRRWQTWPRGAFFGQVSQQNTATVPEAQAPW